MRASYRVCRPEVWPPEAAVTVGPSLLFPARLSPQPHPQRTPRLLYLLGIKIWLHQDLGLSRRNPEKRQDPAQQDGLHPHACPQPLAPHPGPSRPGFIAQPISGLASKQVGKRKAPGPETPALLCPLFGTITPVSSLAPGVISWRGCLAPLSCGFAPHTCQAVLGAQAETFGLPGLGPRALLSTSSLAEAGGLGLRRCHWDAARLRDARPEGPTQGLGPQGPRSLSSCK